MTRSLALRRAVAMVAAVLLVTSVLAAAIGPVATASAATQKVDVVFVYDKTVSMEERADVLGGEIENVVDELESRRIDARYGLVTYASADDIETRTPLTSDRQALIDGLEFEYGGNLEFASDAINVALDDRTMGYRPDAKKVIVVITDEEDDSFEHTEADAIRNLDDEDACLVAVSPENYSDDEDDQLRTMAERVECGQWAEIETGSFTAAITGFDFVGDVWSGDGPNVQVVETSVDDTTVHVGEPVDVRLVVENQGTERGTYHALLTTLNDVHHSERVDVDGGDTHTFTPTVTFDETGTYNLRLNYRTLATIEVEQRPPDPLGAGEVELVDAYTTRSTVWDGESYDVVAVVRNVGDETGQATIEYAGGAPTANTANDSATEATDATETAVLEAGETAEVRHTVTVDDDPVEATTDAWTVGATAGGNATHAGNVTVLPTDEVESGVVDAYAAPGRVGTGDDYDVIGVVHNADDRARLFSLYYAGEGDDAGAFVMVWVDPGETVEVPRSYTAPGEPGTVDWTVNGLSTTVTVGANGAVTAD